MSAIVEAVDKTESRLKRIGVEVERLKATSLRGIVTINAVIHPAANITEVYDHHQTSNQHRPKLALANQSGLGGSQKAVESDGLIVSGEVAQLMKASQWASMRLLEVLISSIVSMP